MILGNITHQVLLIRIPSKGQLIPVYSGAHDAKEEKVCFLASVRAIGRQGEVWKLLLLKDQG